MRGEGKGRRGKGVGHSFELRMWSKYAVLVFFWPCFGHVSARSRGDDPRSAKSQGAGAAPFHGRQEGKPPLASQYDAPCERGSHRHTAIITRPRLSLAF